MSEYDTTLPPEWEDIFYSVDDDTPSLLAEAAMTESNYSYCEDNDVS